ncbi:MAG: sulfur oxidation c-type cytochrome SoxX [Acetobacteraceae bacterium]|nr:sulfur oxidation c-type cytochrome SoxX [Acetobacteraceae bacterium]MDW8398391.1 sulfur oxidation c-type cytochrome SoxX [Acetobacteraceae bacterium]
MRLGAAKLFLGLAIGLTGAALAQTGPLVPYRVVDDAIPESLTGTPGDPDRGRALALDRSKGNCVTCHNMPVNADFQGDLGPPLDGVASRWTEGELRLRIVDSKRINPDSNMPSFYRVEGLTAVRRDWAGRPMLTAQEVEDILAYLLTLR